MVTIWTKSPTLTSYPPTPVQVYYLTFDARILRFTEAVFFIRFVCIGVVFRVAVLLYDHYNLFIAVFFKNSIPLNSATSARGAPHLLVIAACYDVIAIFIQNCMIIHYAAFSPLFDISAHMHSYVSNIFRDICHLGCRRYISV